MLIFEYANQKERKKKKIDELTKFTKSSLCSMNVAGQAAAVAKFLLHFNGFHFRL